MIYVTHGEYQGEVVNLSGRKFFPFSFSLLIFILAYKNSVSRITGIQNIFSEVTVLAYWFEATIKPEEIKRASNIHRHLEVPVIYPTWSGIVFQSWTKSSWAPGFSLGLNEGSATPACTFENIQAASERRAKERKSASTRHCS